MSRITSRVLAYVVLTLIAVEPRLHADTKPPRVKLTAATRDLDVGPRMNAAGRDLRGCEFVGLDLSGAVFDGCSLWDVRIEDCVLTGASFRGVLFAGSKTVEIPLGDRVDVTDATINGVWVAGFNGFDSYGVQLWPNQLMSTWSYKNKDLHQCAIRGSTPSGEPVALDFRRADLRETTVERDCSKCSFTDARIGGVRFGHESITFEQLASTWDFKHRCLRIHLAAAGKPAGASSEKWDFSQMILAGSYLAFDSQDVDFTDATVNDCTIRSALDTRQLSSTRSYRNGSLTGLSLMWSDLSGCDLSAMNLTGCQFSHCKFAGAKFDDAVITDAWFITDKRVADEDQLTLDQIRSTWNYKHGHMEGIRLPEELAETLKK